jgi:hypothetical protein
MSQRVDNGEKVCARGLTGVKVRVRWMTTRKRYAQTFETGEKVLCVRGLTPGKKVMCQRVDTGEKVCFRGLTAGKRYVSANVCEYFQADIRLNVKFA